MFWTYEHIYKITCRYAVPPAVFKEDITSACSPSLFWDDFVSTGGHRDEKFPILHWKIFLYQYIHRHGVRHKALPKKNMRNKYWNMINSQICKSIQKQVIQLNLKGIVNDPQWMGAVRMEAKTADKNITIIHTTPVTQLTSWSEKSLSIMLLSPVKNSSCLNQERNVHRLSTVYKQKQSKTVLKYVSGF